jgi:hypothetical protein
MPFLGPAIAVWIALGVAVMAWYYVSAYRNSGTVQQRREPQVLPSWREPVAREPVTREPWMRSLSPLPSSAPPWGEAESTDAWSEDPLPSEPIAPLPLWRQASWLAATRPVVIPHDPEPPSHHPPLPAYEMENFPADNWGTPAA